MKYVVVWNRARFSVDGKRVVVTKGHEVPAGVDEAVLHDLVLVGAIVAASPPPAPVAAAVAVDPVDPGEVTRPTKAAKVDEWRAYAVAIGVDPDGLKKDELIGAVEAAEAADAPPVGDPDGDDESGDGSPADPDAPTIS